MEKYTIKISLIASEDLKQIALYMKNCLKVPNTARNYLKLLRQEINKLAILPKRHVVIKEEKINQFNVRKLKRTFLYLSLLTIFLSIWFIGSAVKEYIETRN